MTIPRNVTATVTDDAIKDIQKMLNKGIWVRMEKKINPNLAWSISIDTITVLKPVKGSTIHRVDFSGADPQGGVCHIVHTFGSTFSYTYDALPKMRKTK